MKNKIFKFIIFIQALSFFPLKSKADIPAALLESSTILDQTAQETGISGDAYDLPNLIGNIINVSLGILGIVFLVLVVYAGFLYLTDQGKGEKAKKAMQLLTTAVIGIVIIVAAYAISNYVIGAMVAIVS